MTPKLFTLVLTALLIFGAQSAPNQVVELDKPMFPSTRIPAEAQPAGYADEKLIPPSQGPAETQVLEHMNKKPSTRSKRSENSVFKAAILQALQVVDLDVFSAVEQNPSAKTRVKLTKLAGKLTDLGAHEVVLDAVALDASKSVKEFLADGINKERANQLVKALIMYLAIEKETVY